MGKSTPGGETSIVLPTFDLRRMELTLIGDSALICHAWSEKAKRQMLDKQMKKPKEARSAKVPEDDFRSSLYPHPDGGFGFPAVAFKAAAVGACRFVDGLKMTVLRGAFHIPVELLKIEGTPTPREDMVRVGMGAADIRFRGEFKVWRVAVPIDFNASVLSPDQIAHLFNVAGFGVGVGEWRPERDGSFGRFHVARGDETGRVG